MNTDIRTLATFYYNNNELDDIPNPGSVQDIIKILKKYPIPIYDDEEGNPEILSQHSAYLWASERIRLDPPISSTDICALHYKIFKAVGVTDNGAFRKSSKKVRDYQCPEPSSIMDLMEKLDLLLSIADDFIIYSDDEANAYFFHVHNVFECIQPFAYGNGRVGRFLFNILRMRRGLQISRWGTEKEVYFNAIKSTEEYFIEKYVKPKIDNKMGKS